ncbi:serine hydrolase [Clostridium rhizosphaerae]|uniref:serine hydrolase n=1 Tax=Clostridium rhizosphaerae TaxID=2803861 RepID=UPI001FAEE9F7|nr:serine hydrolase [Clostridium rhizosphaerae]
MNKKRLIRLSLLVIGIVLIIVSAAGFDPYVKKIKKTAQASGEVSNQSVPPAVSNDNSLSYEEERDKLNEEKLRLQINKQNEQKRQALEDQIKSYLGKNIDNVGISYYDINSGKQIIINGDKTFLAGSTVKVQMNMVLYDMFQKGQISSSESLKYTPDCYEEGTGILQGQSLISPIPIQTLSDYSILHSDNIATNMIIKKLGYQNMRNLIDEKLGHATDHSENYITANDETALLKLLYSNPENNPFYSKLITNMKITDFHDRIDLYIPQEIAAHKIGDYSNYVNDVGIVYTENPYILSVYTQGVSNASEVIGHISKMIYDYQISKVN